MIFLALLIVPTLIALGMLIFASKRITLMEFGVQMVAQMIVAACAMGCIYYVNTSDSEVINGQVTNKKRERVSCRHGYPCHCHQVCSGSGKSRSCYTHCDTCYEHFFDYDWDLQTNLDWTITIDTVDRQGLREPPRWTLVQKGDPVARSHGYTNYIKASPDSLFRYQGLIEKYKEKLPTYPLNVYDYYRLDRVILVNGAALPDLKDWNQNLSEVNGRLGPSKQTNIIMVVVKDLPDDWFYALSQTWLGGKKNDVVVVLGTSDNQKFTWVNVMSWTDRQIMKIKLRDSLLDVGALDRAKIFPLVEATVSELFVRKNMKDFKYLAGSVTPSPTEFTIAAIISILCSIGLSWYFYEQDPFEGMV